MENEQIDLPQDEDEREAVYDELAERVLANFRQAKDFRSSHKVLGKSVESWLNRLDNAYHKIHEAEELKGRENMRSYFGLIQNKTNMTASYLRSKYVNPQSPPFNIAPTPIVELPQDKQEEGLERVRAELLNTLISHNLPFDALIGSNGFLLPQVAQAVGQLAKNAKAKLREVENTIAADATEKMKTLIKDQLVDGGFSSAIAEAIFDVALYPVMVLGYENEAVTDYVWQKNKFVKETTIRPTFRRIHPKNAYFAPDSSSAQDGAYFIELAKRSKAQLAGFIGNAQLGYLDEVLKDILEQGDDNWLGTVLDNTTILTDLHDDEVAILRCQMLVSGADLIEYGVKLKASEQYDYFNADIEVCNSRVIRCQIVAHPKGERTYFSAGYKRIAGEPYGVSVGMMIYDRQLSINRTQYAMMLNTQYSAGPMLEIDAGAFDNPDEVVMTPYTRVYSNPHRENPAYSGIRQHHIQPTFQLLFNQMTNEIRLADDECGLPSFLNGNAGLQGAGQTLGGLAMMTDNAVLGLEDCAYNIDEFFLRPAVTLLYARNLVGDDDSVKADAKIIPTGLLGLKAELDKAKQLAGLVPQASQIAQQGGIPPQMYADIVAQYFKTQGIDTDKYLSGGNMQVNPNPMVSPTDGLVDKRSLG
ncbi:hypothetical protein E4T80_09855 [Muribacter muris]|uniref:Uncharacterized protein n=1 Tax=Muribacter muris TaxID=67855 RepID=A0A4Y9JRY5_9PAST|nr:hypothetical protein [Muribacter muris]MBF0785762.1 hypothetical protein [Muribacter muris]MBF0828266.1 hypothetical protein [Muribacter muris]TFV08584.1 hypothetical protein E4T80_09855 [Muribacter muris]